LLSFGKLKVLPWGQALPVQDLVLVHPPVAYPAVILLWLGHRLGAIGHVLLALFISSLWARHEKNLLDFALEKGVVLNFLAHENDSVVGNRVVRVPGDFPVVLFLAVNDSRDGIALDADSKPVPIVVGQARTKFDDLSLVSLDALVVEFESPADLET
jgi:hypothetical protein